MHTGTGFANGQMHTGTGSALVNTNGNTCPEWSNVQPVIYVKEIVSVKYK